MWRSRLGQSVTTVAKLVQIRQKQFPNLEHLIHSVAIAAMAALALIAMPAHSWAANATAESAAILATASPVGWQMAETSLEGNSSLNDAVWNGERFVAIGNGASDPATMATAGKAPILTSPDGVHWTPRNSGFVGSLENIVWNGSLFVATGKQASPSSGPVILTSEDGIHWTSQSTESIGKKSRIVKVIRADSQFVAITSGSFKTPSGIFTSPDGSQWTRQWQATGTEELIDIIWTGVQFVAVGDDHGFKKKSKPSPILTSLDGLTWSSRDSGTDVPLRHIVWNGEQFLAVGTNWDYYTGNITASAAVTSLDGVSWNPQKVSGIVTTLSSVVWNGERYVAVGKNGSVLSSRDGTAWEHRLLDASEDMHDVIASESQIIAVGSGIYNPHTLGIVGNAAILTSSDGIQWSRRNSGFIGALRKIIRNDNLYIAVGNEILYADAIAPSITPPANITLTADGKKTIPATEKNISAFLAGAKARDNLDGEISAISHDAPEFFPVGVTTVTFSAPDSAGNTGKITATVTVLDTIAPHVISPKEVTVAASRPSGTPATDAAIANFLAGAKAEDDVDGDISTIISDAPEIFPVGKTSVTFTAFDTAGNKGTASATVNVSPYIDTTAPEITPPADITVAATNSSGTPAANAVITSFLSVASAEDDVDGRIVSIKSDAPEFFPVGATTVTFSARDKAGNIGAATAIVTVEDSTAPLLKAPADITVPATETSGTPATEISIATFLASATAEDNVDGNIPAITHDAPESFPVGETVVTFTASDAAGNAGTATATVTVSSYVDNKVPEVIAPDDITVAATGPSGTPATDETIAGFLAAVTAEDDVDGNITTISSDAPSILPVGTTTVTFSANDAAGNVGTATATITVSDYADVTAPTVTPPSDIVVQATLPEGIPASNGAIVDFLAGVTAEDDVDGSIAPTHDAPEIFPVGITTVTFNATDAAGNSATATATATVSEFTDSTAPLVTPPADVTVAAAGPNGTPASDPTIAEFLAGARAEDDTDGVISNISHDAPEIFPVGETTVIFSATNQAGLNGSATAAVSVSAYVDTTAPLVTPPADITVTATGPGGIPASESAIAAFLSEATALDDIDGDISGVSHDAPESLPVGSAIITFTATDAAGNTGSAMATITVEAPAEIMEAPVSDGEGKPAGQKE